jgi:glycine betaine/proline transport system ATP-binding protein
MQDQLLELQHKLKKTIVFITHDLNEAMRLGDRIAVMRDGRIVQNGTAQDILLRPENDYVASFTQDVDRSRVLTAGELMDTSVTGDAPGCHCETATPATPFTELCAISARLSHPVAVLDADDRQVGVVPRQRLVGFLGDERDAAPQPCDSPRDKGGEKVTADA